MRYADLLTEDRTEALVAKYFDAFLKKADPKLDPESAKIQTTNRLKRIMGYDPTPQKRYADWIMRRALTGAIHDEDLYKVEEYLAVYDRAKARLPLEQRDINRIANEKDLFDLIEPFLTKEKEVSAKAERNALDATMHDPSQATILIDDDELKIVVPKTKAASCYFGRNTQWCTAATSSYNMFYFYNKAGPLYIVLLKKENRRYQLQFREGNNSQFMDERDTPIKLIDLVTAHPKIAEVIGKQKFLPYCLGLFLRDMKESEIRRQLEHTPMAIKGLTDKQQTPKRKLAAAKGAASPWYKGDSDRLDVFYYITKPWPDEVTDIYWKIKLDTEVVPFVDIPIEYLNEKVLVKTLTYRPQDIKEAGGYLTKDLVVELLKKLPRILIYIPEEFRTRDVLRMVGAGHWVSSEYAHRLFRYVNPEQWPYEWVCDAIKHGEIASFEDLPDYFQQPVVHGQPYGNEYVFAELVERYGITAVPKNLWSKHMLRMAGHEDPVMRQRFHTPAGPKERPDPDNIETYKSRWDYPTGDKSWNRQNQASSRYNPDHGKKVDT